MPLMVNTIPKPVSGTEFIIDGGEVLYQNILKYVPTIWQERWIQPKDLMKVLHYVSFLYVHDYEEKIINGFRNRQRLSTLLSPTAFPDLFV